MKSRTLTRVVTTALLALLLTGVAFASQMQVAWAATSTADADVEYGNNNCGDPILGAPVIGTARFVRSSDQLVLRFTMTAGDASTDYEVSLFDADTCAQIGVLGSFSTNAAGRGRFASPRIKVVGSTRFYAAALDTSNFVGISHGSLAVDLP